MDGVNYVPKPREEACRITNSIISRFFHSASYRHAYYMARKIRGSVYARRMAKKLKGTVEVDGLYATAGLKGKEGRANTGGGRR